MGITGPLEASEEANYAQAILQNGKKYKMKNVTCLHTNLLSDGLWRNISSSTRMSRRCSLPSRNVRYGGKGEEGKFHVNAVIEHIQQLNRQFSELSGRTESLSVRTEEVSEKTRMSGDRLYR